MTLDALIAEWIDYRNRGGKLTWKEFRQSAGI